MTVGLLVTAAAMEVYLVVWNSAVQGMTRQRAARDAEFLMDWLARDISFMGAGVPRGKRINSNSGTTLTQELRPFMRRATTTEMAFVGDLPYPNADYNGVMWITQYPPAAGAHHYFGVVSQLSGACMPYKSDTAAKFTCDATSTTMIEGEATFGASDKCTDLALGARTCPWGVNKHQGQSGNTTYIIISQVDGNYYEREWDAGDLTLAGGGGYRTRTVPAPVSDELVYIHLNHNGSYTFTTYASFTSPHGTGFISHPDRVFWQYDNSNKRVLRRQCWGQPNDPNNASWPNVASGSVPATPTNCTAPNEGTDWETMMSNVDSFSLRYFTDINNPATPYSGSWGLAPAGDLRSVEVEFGIKRVAGTYNTLHAMKRRFLIENRGGVYGETAANGGGTTEL
jgi:hypothetical protein